MPKTLSDYFQEGQEANRSGKPQEANPYNHNPHHNPYLIEGAANWDLGWESEHKASYG